MKKVRKGQIVQIHFLCESIGRQCPRMTKMTAEEAANFITKIQQQIKELDESYGLPAPRTSANIALGRPKLT